MKTKRILGKPWKSRNISATQNTQNLVSSVVGQDLNVMSYRTTTIHEYLCCKTSDAKKPPKPISKEIYSLYTVWSQRYYSTSIYKRTWQNLRSSFISTTMLKFPAFLIQSGKCGSHFPGFPWFPEKQKTLTVQFKFPKSQHF